MPGTLGDQDAGLVHVRQLFQSHCPPRTHKAGGAAGDRQAAPRLSGPRRRTHALSRVCWKTLLIRRITRYAADATKAITELFTNARTPDPAALRNNTGLPPLEASAAVWKAKAACYALKGLAAGFSLRRGIRRRLKPAARPQNLYEVHIRSGSLLHWRLLQVFRQYLPDPKSTCCPVFGLRFRRPDMFTQHFGDNLLPQSSHAQSQRPVKGERLPTCA